MPSVEELIAAFLKAGEKEEEAMQAALDEAGANYDLLLKVAVATQRGTKPERVLVQHLLQLATQNKEDGNLYQAARLLSISARYSEVWSELQEQVFTLAYGVATKSLLHEDYDAAREACYAATACSSQGTNRRKEANVLALTVARAAIKARKQ